MIFVDNGYGYRKLIVNGKEIIFSSMVGDYQETDNFLGNDDLSIRIENLGQWSFGHTARLQSALAGREQSSKWIFEPEYLAGMLLGISLGYSTNTHHISTNVITGLPGQDYNKPKEFIAKFKNHLSGQYVIHRNGTRQTIEIGNVGVTSQAYGPVFLQLIDDTGKLVKLNTPEKVVKFGSVNIGFNTVEIGTVEVNTKTFNLDTAKGFELSEPKGIHTLIKRYQDVIRQQHGLHFDTDETIKIIENNGFRLDGNWIEFNPVDIKKEYAKQIGRFISQVWGDDVRKLYQIIVTGGGANIVRGLINYPQITITDNPQMDIVRGYQRLSKV